VGLPAFLSGLTVEHTDLAAVYVVKFGCIAFRPPSDDLPTYPDGMGYGAEFVKEWPQYLETALSSHPNVFDLKNHSGNVPSLVGVWPRKGGAILEGSMLSFRVSQPGRLQKFSEPSFSEVTPIETFDVLTTGSLFTAYARVPSFPARAYIGHEYREMLAAHLETNPHLRAETIGPTPLHPSIYIVVLTSAAQDLTFGQIITHKGDLVVLAKEGESVRKLVWELFAEAHGGLRQFYGSSLIRIDATEIYIAILNAHTEVSRTIADLHATPRYRFLRMDSLGDYGPLCRIDRVSSSYAGPRAQPPGDDGLLRRESAAHRDAVVPDEAHGGDARAVRLGSLGTVSLRGSGQLLRG
jgi:hypothetical protein